MFSWTIGLSLVVDAKKSPALNAELRETEMREGFNSKVPIPDMTFARLRQFRQSIDQYVPDLYT